jgi:hypothetical protein
MSDFRRVSGLVFAFGSTDTDLKTGKVLESASSRNIIVNPPVDPVFFETLETAPSVAIATPTKN